MEIRQFFLAWFVTTFIYSIVCLFNHAFVLGGSYFKKNPKGIMVNDNILTYFLNFSGGMFFTLFFCFIYANHYLNENTTGIINGVIYGLIISGLFPFVQLQWNLANMPFIPKYRTWIQFAGDVVGIIFCGIFLGWLYAG